MTFEQYMAVLIKQWKLVVLCFVIAGSGAYGVSLLMTPIYESTALIQIAIGSGNSQLDFYSSLLASNQLVETEATLATSDPVLRDVAANHPDLTVDQLAKEVTAIPKPDTQLFAINVQDSNPQRAADIANAVATTLIQRQLQVAEQAGKQSGSFLLVAQSAQPSSVPVRPNVPLNTAAGLVTGLLLGLLLAILFEQLDVRVRTPEALTQLYNWPVLATILRERIKDKVVNPSGKSANIEPYRILRTNIGFSSIDRPLRTFAVTSAMPGDGKSAIAANLAIFMARAGKNTLLVDADLRRPKQHEQFGLPAHAMGFSNAILACSIPTDQNSQAHQELFSPSTQGSTGSISPPKFSLDPFVHTVDIPNMYVMPSGPLPPNPSELLDSKAMQRLLKILGACGAEVIIFDTPPLLGLSDASILTSKVDGTLLVVDITQANKGKLRQTKRLLAQAGANTLGCVVNKKRPGRNDILSYYYYNTDALDKSRDDARWEKTSSTATFDDLKEGELLPSTARNNMHELSKVASSAPFDPDSQTMKLPLFTLRTGDLREDS